MHWTVTSSGAAPSVASSPAASSRGCKWCTPRGREAADMTSSSSPSIPPTARRRGHISRTPSSSRRRSRPPNMAEMPVGHSYVASTSPPADITSGHSSSAYDGDHLPAGISATSYRHLTVPGSRVNPPDCYQTCLTGLRNPDESSCRTSVTRVGENKYYYCKVNSDINFKRPRQYCWRNSENGVADIERDDLRLATKWLPKIHREVSNTLRVSCPQQRAQHNMRTPLENITRIPIPKLLPFLFVSVSFVSDLLKFTLLQSLFSLRSCFYTNKCRESNSSSSNLSCHFTSNNSNNLDSRNNSSVSYGANCDLANLGVLGGTKINNSSNDEIFNERRKRRSCVLRSNDNPLVLLFALFTLLLSMPPCLPALGTPPRYSRDSMPNTSFTCDDKASGGYYADPDAECQMFHVCVRVSEEEIRDHKFLCPNDTIFDQQNFICASFWDTDCKKSEHYYSKNDLFRVNDPWALPPPANDTAVQSAKEEEEPVTTPEGDQYYDYILDYDTAAKSAPADALYDYEYYDPSTGLRQKRKRGGSPTDYETPSVARSVSESSTSSDLKLSKTFQILSNSGSQSTLEPAFTSASTATTTKVTTTTKESLVTERPPFTSPFAASFDVGKPVVSISSTSSRFEVSSPRYEHSTPQYGYFSVQLPSSTPSYKPRISTSTTSQSTTSSPPITSTQSAISTDISFITSTSKSTAGEEKPVFEHFKELKAEDLASYSDSEDPFADIDWKKDSSGVTSTTKTRYETLFGPVAASAEQRRPAPPTIFPLGRRRATVPEVEGDTERKEDQSVHQSVVTSTSSSSVDPNTSYVTATRADRTPRNRVFSDGSITGRRRGSFAQDEANVDPSHRRRIYTGPSRQDFSNFRYFKTAFGSTETVKTTSARPNRSRQTSRPQDEQFSKRSSLVETPNERKERTASRRTRYSMYA